MKNKNLIIWDQVKETDPNYTKKVSFGAIKYTSVGAYYQIEKATEIFGPYGKGFGLSEFNFEFMTFDDGQILVNGKGTFFFTTEEDNKEAEVFSFPVAGSIMVYEWSDKKGKHILDDDYSKKLETSLITKALSRLGFSADIFTGLFDDDIYLNSLKQKYKKEPNKPQNRQAPQNNQSTGQNSTQVKQNQKEAIKTAENPSSKSPGIAEASEKDVLILIQLVENGQFDRALSGLKWWESYGRSIKPEDKKKINDLININANNQLKK